MSEIVILISPQVDLEPRTAGRERAQASMGDAAAVLAWLDRVDEHGSSRGARTQRILLDGAAATRNNIEAAVSRVASQAGANDRVKLFLIGRGFGTSARNGVVVADTTSADVVGTSLDLGEIVALLSSSRCTNVAVFLDIAALADFSDLDDELMRAAVEASTNVTCFVARRSGEVTSRGPALGTSIWLHHLLEALGGLAPAALDRDGRVTSRALQQHLEAEVPRTLRTTFNDRRIQSPWFCHGARNGAVLTDSNTARDESLSTDASAPARLRHVVLVGAEFTPIKQLSGYRKGQHAVPNEKGASSDAFVARVAVDEVRVDLESRASALRAAFGFKRKDLVAHGPDAGAASIVTPFFDYDVRVDIDPDDPSRCRTTRRLSNVRVPERVLAPEFDDVFGAAFDTLEFHTSSGLDVAEVVDRIEERDEPAITVAYDTALTHCFVRIAGLPLEVEIRSHVVRLRAPRGCPPADLFEGYLRLLEELGSALAVRPEAAAHNVR